jgi:GABA permease
VISTGALSLALVVGWVRSRMYGTPWMGSRAAKVVTQS